MTRKIEIIGLVFLSVVTAVYLLVLPLLIVFLFMASPATHAIAYIMFSLIALGLGGLWVLLFKFRPQSKIKP